MFIVTKNIALLIFTFFLFFSNSVFAHSGRTNSSGCHNDRKTGGYHCHNKGTKSSTYSSHPKQSQSSTNSNKNKNTYTPVITNKNTKRKKTQQYTATNKQINTSRTNKENKNIITSDNNNSSLDLRYCLKLENNKKIIECAEKAQNIK